MATNVVFDTTMVVLDLLPLQAQLTSDRDLSQSNCTMIMHQKYPPLLPHTSCPSSDAYTVSDLQELYLPRPKRLLQ